MERPPIDIVPIKDQAKQEVWESTIELLEGLLDMARQGQVHEVMAVGISHDSEDIVVKCSSTLSLIRQLGSLDLARAVVLSDMES